MNKILSMMVFILMTVSLLGAIEVKNITARQRYPWNGLVDIDCEITNNVSEVDSNSYYIISFSATNTVTGEGYAVRSILNCIVNPNTSKLSENRRCVWNAKADMPKGFKTSGLALYVTMVQLGGVQLWENGPYWAEWNVGATKPEEAGYYFWWGDTVGYTYDGSQWNAVDGSRKGFQFNNSNCPTYDKSNEQLQSEGYIDSTGNLVAKYDAATKHWGAPWRMPTGAEIDALISHCDIQWTTRNGVAGRLVKGRGAYASKSIFLPAAGGYWSSTTLSEFSDIAWGLYFDSYEFTLYDYGRYRGQSVRPLREFAQ